MDIIEHTVIGVVVAKTVGII